MGDKHGENLEKMIIKFIIKFIIQINGLKTKMFD
jgi:hypothetical protein